MRIGTLVVVGVGLIGGSLALALKARSAVGTVIGIGRSRENLAIARELGVVDRAHALTERWDHEIARADVVLVATPVGQYPALFGRIAAALGEATVVTDAGSTKADVAAAARAAFAGALPRFVPAHPIAGTENSGAAAAFASLYEGRRVIVTPLSETDAGALATVEAMWMACGARVGRLAPDEHDRVFAAVSHLPHVLAAALVAATAERTGGERLLAYAGSGFRDVTRIAAASPEMWRDILLANRDFVGAEIGRCRAELARIEGWLAGGDAGALEHWLARAARVRRTWLAQAPDGNSE